MNSINLKLILRLLSYSFGFWFAFFLTLFAVALPAQQLKTNSAIIQTIFGIFFILIFFKFTKWFAHKFDRLNWNDLGFTKSRSFFLQLLRGAGLALVFSAVQLLIEYKLGWTQISDRTFIPDDKFHWSVYPLLALVGVSASGFCEELAFRGYIWKKLEYYRKPLLTLFLTALFFAIVPHINNLSAPFFIFAFLMGLLLGWFRYYSGALWLSIGFHWAWNWCQGGLWGSKGHSLIHVSRELPNYQILNQQVAGDDLLQTLLVAFSVVIGFILFFLKDRSKFLTYIETIEHPYHEKTLAIPNSKI